MLIQKETNHNSLSIKKYQPGSINISGKEFGCPLVLTASAIKELSNDIVFAEISTDILQSLVNTDTEILLVGSGEKHLFVPSKEIAPLLKSGIAVESMATRNACHTFQVLTYESRKVVALLFP